MTCTGLAKICLRFYGKTQVNFMANPILYLEKEMVKCTIILHLKGKKKNHHLKDEKYIQNENLEFERE